MISRRQWILFQFLLFVHFKYDTFSHNPKGGRTSNWETGRILCEDTMLRSNAVIKVQVIKQTLPSERYQGKFRPSEQLTIFFLPTRYFFIQNDFIQQREWCFGTNIFIWLTGWFTNF